jgi:hypothetical protein
MVTTHLHLVLRSRMCVATPPLPPVALWRGAQLKHRDNFTFTLPELEDFFILLCHLIKVHVDD